MQERERSLALRELGEGGEQETSFTGGASSRGALHLLPLPQGSSEESLRGEVQQLRVIR